MRNATLVVLTLAVAAGCGSSPTLDHELVATTSSPLACDVSGRWATRVVVPVSWLGSLGLKGGSGEIVEVFEIVRVHTGTSFIDTYRVCGISSPDSES